MQRATHQQSSQTDLETLQELNRHFIRSVGMSNARWFDDNLSDDFMNSNADGSLVDRAEFLAQIARPCAVSDFAAEDVRIRLLGDFAIVHGRTVYKRSDDQAGAGRYTDIYARRQGRWVCVSADVTRG